MVLEGLRDYKTTPASLQTIAYDVERAMFEHMAMNTHRRVSPWM